MQDRLTELFHLHFSRSSSAEQQQEFLELVSSGKHDQQLQELIEGLYHQYDSNEQTQQNSYYPEGARQRMLQNIFGEGKYIRKYQPLSIWKHTGFRIAVAAALASIIFGAALFLFTKENKQAALHASYAQDLNPGKQGATLTLASGKKIRLAEASAGELAKQAGIRISKTQAGEITYEATGSDNQSLFNTFETAKGETYRLRLPDGSTVWLNSASRLTYSARLTENGKRSVSLIGEGFFQVSKDKAHPFIVSTGGQEVEVLGTQFNVNSYPDEKAVATTLIEGSVKVRTGAAEKVIRPGEQASVSNANISVNQVNLENVTDWKDGEFNLDGTDFKVAMRKIARWYDVEVIYDSSVPDNIVSGGYISRNARLSTILEGIERSGQVKFKLEGRKVFVSR